MLIGKYLYEILERENMDIIISVQNLPIWICKWRGDITIQTVNKDCIEMLVCLTFIYQFASQCLIFPLQTGLNFTDVFYSNHREQ